MYWAFVFMPSRVFGENYVTLDFILGLKKSTYLSGSRLLTGQIRGHRCMLVE